MSFFESLFFILFLSFFWLINLFLFSLFISETISAITSIMLLALIVYCKLNCDSDVNDFDPLDIGTVNLSYRYIGNFNWVFNIWGINYCTFRRFWNSAEISEGIDSYIRHIGFFVFYKMDKGLPDFIRLKKLLEKN
mgnify:FL=1